MNQEKSISYMKGFLPYGLAAFLIGIIGGLSTVLGPSFVQDMNLPYNNTTWTALSQAISTASCAPILGKMGDIFGRRKTLLIGLSVYLSGNIMSALAPSLPFMLLARFIVGIGTAAVAPTVISYIITEFPPQQIAKGFSLYMLISSSAVIFGPGIGGLILNASNWRILMWLSSGICFIFLILCLITLPQKETAVTKITSFDGWGSAFIILFFSLLLCIPSFGQNFGWLSANFIIVLILAVISLIALFLAEKKATNPLLSGKFMLRKSFILPVLILFLTQGLMQANMTNTIVFVNYTQPGQNALSGYAISILYLGMSLGAILLGPVADRYEPKRILTFSLIFTGIGCGLMVFFSTNTPFGLLASALGILGFGLGANATIFMKIVLADIPPQTAGAGTGIYGLFRDLAAPFGVAVFVPFFTNEVARRISTMNGTVTSAEAAVGAIQQLAFIELICIVISVLIVQFLPKIYKKS